MNDQSLLYLANDLLSLELQQRGDFLFAEQKFLFEVVKALDLLLSCGHHWWAFQCCLSLEFMRFILLLKIISLTVMEIKHMGGYLFRVCLFAF